VPYPAASSWFYDLSRLLPLDTDLTPFLQAGVSGYNFSTSYLYPEIRTPRDRLEIVNPGSVQHAGEQAVALARSLSNLDLSHTTAPDLVYFNLFGPLVVRYPASWAVPLAVFTLLFLLVVFGLGLKRHILSGRGVWHGVFVFLLALLLVLVASLLLWLAGFLIRPPVFAAWLTDPRHASHDWLFFTALIALTAGLITILYRLALKKTALLDLMLGVFIFWGVLGLVSSYSLPGASYLFSGPLLFGLLVTAGLLYFTPPGSRPSPALTGVLWAGTALPLILLWIPFLLLFFMATALGVFPALVICLALFFALLQPVFIPVLTSPRNLFSPIVLSSSLLLFVAGILVS
jgi:hypothetical protein